MNVFLIYVRDDNFCRLLPEELNPSRSDDGRIKVMAFPPLGIQTLAPVLRQRGHQVRMFDTCHPQMKAEHIAQAVAAERPDVIALSFLSTTTYPAVKQHGPATQGRGAEDSDHRRRRLCHRECGPHPEGLPGHRLRGRRRGRGASAGLLGATSTIPAQWRVWSGATARRSFENAPRPLLRDLDQFPYPDRTSLPIDYIESLPLDVPAVLSLDKFCTVQTSRGCPYSCIYCDIPSLARGPLALPVRRSMSWANCSN